MLCSSTSSEQTMHRGMNCFKMGQLYELKIANRLKSVAYKGHPILVGTTASATANPDIPLTIVLPTETLKINIEAKNRGAFEGGCKKLYPTPQGMKINEECIQKFIIGEQLLYNGHILPWNRGQRTMEDWQKEKHIFDKDIYIEAATDAISEYYAKKGTQYIQIENKGLYHTGSDPLGLCVPMFKSNVVLRIRCTKHMHTGTSGRIPMDITAALQFNRRTLQSSPYTLDEGGQLPLAFTHKEQSAAE